MSKEQIRQRWAKMPEGPYHYSYMRVVAPESEVASEQDPKLRPGVWSWERFHAETLANAQQDIHDLLSALDAVDAKAISEECEVHCDTVHDLVVALDAVEAKVAELEDELDYRDKVSALQAELAQRVTEAKTRGEVQATQKWYHTRLDALKEVWPWTKQ